MKPVSGTRTEMRNLVSTMETLMQVGGICQRRLRLSGLQIFIIDSGNSEHSHPVQSSLSISHGDADRFHESGGVHLVQSPVRHKISVSAYLLTK